jgi:hypothetical protein
MAERGYIAVARDIFERPIFNRLFSHRPYSRLDAYLWLLARAAWKPRGHATPYGAVHNARAELSYTERELASAWHWRKTTVHRFLARLMAEGMIRIELRRPGPETGPETGPKPGYERSTITICDYSLSQGNVKGARAKSGPETGPKTGPELPLFGLISHDNFSPNQTNQSNHKKDRGTSRTVARQAPPHNAEITVGGRKMRFFEAGSAEWEMYSRHLADSHNITMLPSQYEDAAGRWFYLDGNPEKKRTRR